MNPDPQVVVDALKWARLGWVYDDDVGHHIRDAVPHAEAIAEMWPHLQHHKFDEPTTLAVQELVAAARGMERYIPTSPNWGANLRAGYGKAAHRLRAALKPFEEKGKVE